MEGVKIKKGDWSGPVSRVLFPRTGKGPWATTISLGRRLPGVSSSRPGRNDETGRFVPTTITPKRGLRRTSSCLALLPMGFTEPDRSPGLLVSSYLTVSPLPAERTPQAVCFLWHFPWPRGRWALPTIAPCGARTFLPPASSRRPKTPRYPPAGDHPVRSSPKSILRRIPGPAPARDRNSPSCSFCLFS